MYKENSEPPYSRRDKTHRVPETGKEPRLPIPGGTEKDELVLEDETPPNLDAVDTTIEETLEKSGHEKEQTTKQEGYKFDKEAKPKAIVVHCSDPRFQKAFAEFIEAELGLGKGEYIPFVIAGGASTLLSPLGLPKEFKFMKDRLVFLKENFPSIERVVLVNHEDCAYSSVIRTKVAGFVSGKLKGALDALGKHKKDLTTIGEIVKRYVMSLSPVSIELYFAEFADPNHDRIVFKEIL